MQALAILLVGLCACGDDTSSTGPGGSSEGGGGAQVELPPPLGPIAPVAPTDTDRFRASGACNQCHLAGDGPLMRDPITDEDLSPGGQWRASMMALAARDPFYLAVLSEQLQLADDREAVEAVCLRCHAPAGSEEALQVGAHLGLDELLTGSSAPANLGRDGVTCSLCHQIAEDNLGEVESFTGGFEVGFSRQMFGPHEGPRTDPMEFFVEYTPTYSEHIGSSELCATCHTVIIPVLDGGDHVGDFVEQAPYFEWLNSSLGSTPCRSCHLPVVDSSGAPLATPIATYPESLPTREPFGVHSFEGANAYMLQVLAEDVAWTGSDVTSAELTAAAARSVRHLETAATLDVSASPSAEGHEIAVLVENQTAHKLPTGYPGRRLWLHVVAKDDAGAPVFESGAWNDEGEIVDGAGLSLEPEEGFLPHVDVVSSESQVALWESVPGDWAGAPTYVPLAAVAYVKDNRILPDGWEDDGPYTDWTHTVGVSGDPSFGPGRDQVRFDVPASAASVEVELVYQTMPPTLRQHLAKVPTPAAVRLTQMAAGVSPAPIVIARAEQPL